MKKPLVLTVLSIICLQCSESRKQGKNEGKTVFDVYSKHCLPKKTDRLVYRYQNASHIFVGFDNLQKNKVFTIFWKIKENNNEILEKSETRTYRGQDSTDLRISMSAQNILAATNSNCGYSIEPPYRGSFSEYPQSESRNEKDDTSVTLLSM